jgi:hypothetical protein
MDAFPSPGRHAYHRRTHQVNPRRPTVAGDWIKFEKTTLTKPEILLLADRLGIHRLHAVGLCLSFWAWCDDQLGSCHAKSVTESMIDSVVGVTGFASALLEIGWLRSRNGSVEVPNLDRHISESAKNRALSGKRKAKSRHGNVTGMSRSERDKSVTREEKRREEVKTEEPPYPPRTGGEVIEPPPPVSTAPKPKPNRQPSGDHAIAVEAFCTAWQARYRVKYPFAGAKDGVAVKFVLNAVSGDLNEFKKVVLRYLADEDRFYASGDRHSLSKLRQHLARYLTDEPASTPRPPPKARFQSQQDSIMTQAFEAAASADDPDDYEGGDF